MSPEQLSKLLSKFIMFEPVGSRVTCDPPPTDTDADYLVAANRIDKATDIIVDAGFSWSDEHGQEYQHDVSRGGSRSFRKEEINILVTDNLDFYDNFIAATCVAKRLNILDKSDRIALFQAVLYGKSCDMRE